jgi:hypothetical protein
MELGPLSDDQALVFACHDQGMKASAAMRLGCRSAFGGKNRSGTRKVEIGPGLQVVERVDP